MNPTYAFGAAILFSAGALWMSGLDGSRATAFTDRAAPEAIALSTAPAARPAATQPATAAAPVTLTAAAVQLDPPPNALVCSEQTAELRVAAGAPVEDFLDEFFLVSDPRDTCRSADLAARGGYDPDAGRCYTLRSPESGAPDLPLVCTEALRHTGGGVGVGAMQCSGWKRRIQTAADGGFSLTLAGSDGALPARTSNGNCRTL